MTFIGAARMAQIHPIGASISCGLTTPYDSSSTLCVLLYYLLAHIQSSTRIHSPRLAPRYATCCLGSTGSRPARDTALPRILGHV